jgi:trigger factor
MNSTRETLEGNKVKLSISVDEAEFDKDIDQAFRKIGREIRLPGFRAGKAPRRVLEARIGLGPAREQALRDSIPQYLARAVREHDVDLIATPEIQITAGEESGAVGFDATCEVRPEITVPGYGGLRVEVPSPDVSSEEIDEAVEAERKRHGRLVDVERPAAEGDHVTVDIAASRDGDDVAGLNADEWTYEIGQGWISDDFDDQLVGASPGEELTFATTPKGTSDQADFTVKVHRVQALDVPELTDEWVSDHVVDAESVDDWRGQVEERLAAAKLEQSRRMLIPRTSEALAKLVDIEPPESLVQGDLQRRVETTVRQLQGAGIDMEQWLAATGQDSAGFVENLKGQSVQAVKVDLALRSVAAAEDLQAEPDDLAAEYARIGIQVRQSPGQVRKAYERNDAVPELAAEIRKSKALDWLLHHVEVVDPDGKPIDRDLVLGHSHDDDHDDHAHDEHAHDEHDHADGESAEPPPAETTEGPQP